MWWMLAAQAVSMVASNASSRKAMKRQTAAAQAAAKAQNDANIRESAVQIGEVNRQRTITNIKTAQAMLHYKKQGLSASSKNIMMVAASETTGTASAILESEVQRQQDEAMAQETFNFETAHLNYNNQVNSIVNGTKSRFQDTAYLADSWRELQSKEVKGMQGLAMQAATMAMGSDALGKFAKDMGGKVSSFFGKGSMSNLGKISPNFKFGAGQTANLGKISPNFKFGK